MAADRVSMSKYSGLRDPNFELVNQRLQVLVADAPAGVERKWRYWNATRGMYSYLSGQERH